MTQVLLVRVTVIKSKLVASRISRKAMKDCSLASFISSSVIGMNAGTLWTVATPSSAGYTTSKAVALKSLLSVGILID